MNINKLAISLLALSSLFYVSGYSEPTIWQGEKGQNKPSTVTPSGNQQTLTKPDLKKQAAENQVDNKKNDSVKDQNTEEGKWYREKSG